MFGFGGHFDLLPIPSPFPKSHLKFLLAAATLRIICRKWESRPLSPSPFQFILVTMHIPTKILPFQLPDCMLKKRKKEINLPPVSFPFCIDQNGGAPVIGLSFRAHFHIYIYPCILILPFMFLGGHVIYWKRPKLWSKTELVLNPVLPFTIQCDPK